VEVEEWHRRQVGGMWDEVGRLQSDFLVAQGLRPEHYLLDIGCGSLRGGVHFIRYLEPEHYWGIDRDVELLAAGKQIELPRYNLEERRPNLIEMSDFGFARLGRRFDFALAQSVFTHLPLNDIIRCLINVEQALRPGGRFYATFFENPAGKRNLEPISQPVRGGQPVVSYFDRDHYHYDMDTFRWICADTELEPDYIGDWNHPRSQKMLVFRRRVTSDEQKVSSSK
jgi:SAM-dependent methyltransferase